MGDYLPCPICGERSLAEITDHSCQQCSETYKFCLRHSEEADRAIAGRPSQAGDRPVAGWPTSRQLPAPAAGPWPGTSRAATSSSRPGRRARSSTTATGSVSPGSPAWLTAGTLRVGEQVRRLR
jgi:hypothetical protein